MTWNSGTSTDYIDLLDQLIEVLTSRHLETIAVNAGGTGYAVGDILAISNTGATLTHAAQIEVLTLSGSAIATARIYRGGAYTVDPSTLTGNGASAVTGTGTGATFDLTFADTGWTLSRRTKVAVSATVGAGGTGYTVGDDLTLQGGVLGEGGVAAVFNVDSVAGGVVTGVSLVSAGQYEVPPTNPSATTVAPAGGTGATLNVTYADKTGNTVVVLTGDAGGSNIDPIVVIKTYQGLDQSGLNATANWALFMATTNSLVLPVHQLPNISDGFNALGDGTITSSASGDGAFVPLKTADAFNMTWWISATGRRFHLVAKVIGASTTYYASFSIGLLNPLGITTEMPYPAYIIGTSDRPLVWYRDTSSLFGGLSDLISRNNGPAFFWAPEGTWLDFRVATIATNTSLTPSYVSNNIAPRASLWPLGYGNPHATTEDILWQPATSTGFDNAALTQAGPVIIYRTPDTGGDLFPLFPLTVTQSDNTSSFYRTLGEVHSAFWFSTAGETISSEDRFQQGDQFYTIFQSGTRLEPFSFFCLREE